MDLTLCPKCSEVSEIQWLAVIDSTDGPVDHAKIFCVNRHSFFLPVASLGEHSLRLEDVVPAGRQQTVRQVMTPPMITIEAGAHLAAAAFLMRHAHNSSLVVVADNTREPVAMITEADIANAVAQGRDTENVRVHEVVTTNLMTVRADAVAADAIRLMLPEGAWLLPVVEDRLLVGMVKLADLVRAYLMPGPVAVAEA
jgi:signal-transduction protein with cAMP-binding, CBS, and nucleotidyltransferase domain